MTLKELAIYIKEILKSKSEFIYQDLPKDDPKKRCPDISKAKEVLDWEPVVDIKEGLEKTIEYFSNI